MELLLWQYIIMVIIAIILLATIIIFAKGLLYKLIYSALWIVVAGFLLALFFKII